MLLVPCLFGVEAFADGWKGQTDSSGNRHGTWERFLGKSKVAVEIVNYRHGVPNGPSYKLYHQSGRKQFSTIFKDGNHHGAYAEYHDNKANSKKFEGAHSEGRRSGKWTEFYGSGGVLSVSNYVNGTLQGPAEYSYSSGNKKSTTVYKDGQHHGPYLEYYDNVDNSKSKEGRHANNKKSGIWTEWHANKQVKSIESYYEGALDGPAQYFYSSPGKKRAITVFKQGQHHGPYAEFFDNAANSKHFLGTHRENERFGQWTEWYSNGVEMWSQTYRDGKLHGSVTRFHDNGEVDFRTSYKYGKRHGAFVQYFHPAPFPLLPDLADIPGLLSGKAPVRMKDVKKVTGVYKDGHKVGDWIEWDYRGANSRVSPYVRGKLHGTDRRYRNSSLPGVGVKLHSEDNYKDGVRHGEYIEYWNDNKNKHIQSRWVNGSKDGPSMEWHENGKISVSGQFKKAQKDGVWKEFDDEGKLLKTYAYNMGKLVKGSQR